MKRQKIRKLFLLISLLLFPVTMWYFSPAVIYVIYYGVILLLICPALIHGRGHPVIISAGWRHLW